MPLTQEEPSLGQLFRDLSHETGTLLRKEVELAKAEVSEKASRAATNTQTLAIGAGVALVGATILMVALVTGLTALLATFMPTELAAFLAPLLVGGTLTFVGYGRVRKGLAAFREESIVPERTKEALQETTVWLKARMS